MMPAVAPNSKAGAVKAAPVNAWRVPRDWEGETVFIIGGGPSVADVDLTVLRERRVLVVNSSYAAALAAGLAPELLVFGDSDWWAEHCAKLLASFAGRIVTAADVNHPRVLRLRNSRPDRTGSRPPLAPLRLSDDPAAVPLRRTSMVAALNIAWLGGACAIVTLGLDGRAAGMRTHHHAPHRKPVVKGCWDVQGRYDLAPIVADLGARGCAVLNASPGSVHTFAPVMTLVEAIARVEERAAA